MMEQGLGRAADWLRVSRVTFRAGAATDTPVQVAAYPKAAVGENSVHSAQRVRAARPLVPRCCLELRKPLRPDVRPERRAGRPTGKMGA